MDRPLRFQDHRWVGDKRSQVVHDVDHCTSPDVIDQLMAAGTYTCFGPDTAVEAANRGYKRCSACAGARQAAAADQALDEVT